MTQLFDRLPDRLFSPLASANRRIYGALLLDLYPLFFDQIHADVFPSRDTVRQEIEERLAVMAAAWQEEPDAASIPVSPAEPEATPAALNYGGVQWDLTPLRPYVALSADAIGDLRPTRDLPYLLTIENLASFQRQVREIQDAGVVIYTAGFPAPALVRVLGRLDQCLPTDCPFYHWGVRDPGGLRIYAKVNSACPAHGLSPHLMTVPDPGPSGWTRDQRRALEQVIARGGTAGRLAEAWIAQGLGPQEQEGLDPKAPGEEGCQAGAAVP